MSRVEGVDAARFTQVLRTERGRPVRADFAVVQRDAPSCLAWRQELAGSPFARVLESSVIRIELASTGRATTVTLTHEQRLRGASRTGGLMLRRATARRLDQALSGLAAVSEG